MNRTHRSLTPAKAYRLQNGKEADANLKAKWESEAKRKREQVSISSTFYVQLLRS